MTDVRTKMAGDDVVSRIAYQVARALVYAVVRVFNRVQIEGRHNIPKRGPFVLAPIHRSVMDTPYASMTTRRRMRYMGKDSLWKFNPAVSWLISALGAFPVTRGSSDREALLRAIEVLKLGDGLVIFPEGERKAGPVVQPLFEGAVYLAGKAGAPIIPMGIGGSERVMPKGSRMIWPRKVTVRIGEPIVVPTADKGRLPRATVQDCTQHLHDTLQRLYDEAQLAAGA
jgi:1-acyl-sn-glycerol-3-phosphate acyltransferase